MIRAGDRASLVEEVPFFGGAVTLLVHLDLDRHGRLVALARQRRAGETPLERDAAELLATVANRLTAAGGVEDLVRQARHTLELLENLAALQGLHADAARRVLASLPAPAPRFGETP